jgi:hypothetical protein
MLDITFDYYSYDKVRRLFSLNIKSDDYMIPNEREALSELERILSFGLTSRILQINRNIISNPSNLLDKFQVTDVNLLSTNPVFLAIFNTISKLQDIKLDFEITNLYNISKEIVDLNIDSIFNKERNKIQSLIEIGKILKDGFK